MNEREVQAFLSGLPKHVPQRMAKFRAGQIISDSMHGLSGVGVVENGRVDIYAVALDGRDVQLNSIGAGECFGICNLLVAEPLQTVLRCAEETTVRFWEKEALVAAMRGDAALAMAYAALCNAKIQFLLSRIEMLTGQSVGVSAGRKAGRRRDFAARHAGRAGQPPIGQPCGAVSRTFGAAKRGLSGSRRKQASGSEHIGA